MEPDTLIFLNTETVLLLRLATARSSFPSPSISPADIPHGEEPAGKSTLAANELVVMEPGVPVFRNIEIVPSVLFATIRSGLPSPSISPMATVAGLFPVMKSTFEASEDDVIEPGVAVFLKTETVLEALKFATTISIFPSPSMSPTAIPHGLVPLVPVAKSTLEANDPDDIEPELLIFLNIDIVLLVLLETIRSAFPSPSISAIALNFGLLPAEKSTFVAKVVASITCELGKVTVNGVLE